MPLFARTRTPVFWAVSICTKIGVIMINMVDRMINAMIISHNEDNDDGGDGEDDDDNENNIADNLR